MIRRTVSRRAKACALVAVVYLVAGALAWAVTAAATADLRPAQHGPVRPAPDAT